MMSLSRRTWRSFGFVLFLSSFVLWPFVAYGGGVGGGSVDQSISLNGAGDYVSVADSALLDLTTGAITVEAWVKTPIPTPNAWTGIVTNTGSAAGTPNYGLRITSTGRVEFLIGDGTQGTYYPVQTLDNYLTANTWHHLAGVFDPAASPNILLYIDGTLVSSGTTTITPTAGTGPLYIGSDIGGTGTFEGQIDEVRVWNFARSQADIQTRMSKALNGSESGLVGYWNFDRDTTAATDRTANALDGTLVGAPTFLSDEPSLYAVRALFFNGANGSVSTSSPVSITTGLYTLAAWIKPNTTPASDQWIAAHPGGYPQLFLAAGGTITGGHTDVNSLDQFVTSTSTAPAGVWTHVALTFDGTNITLYVNGKRESTLAASGPASNANAFEIGWNSVLGGLYFDGAIDEVRIWDGPLTEDEIRSDMVSTTPVAAASATAVAHYGFDKGVPYDHIGGNDGVASVGVWSDFIPLATIPVTSLAFPTTPLGTSTVLTFDVQNTGNAVLTITNATSSSVAFSISPPSAYPILLVPGSIATFTVTQLATHVGFDRSLLSIEHDGTGAFEVTATGTTSTTAPTGNLLTETKIAFAYDAGGTGEYSIHLIDPGDTDGSTLRRVTNPATGESDRHPAWSPDGTQIAFVRQTATVDNVYLIDSDGTNLRNLTNHTSGTVGELDWSVNGLIVYAYSASGGAQDIYVLPSSGGTPVQVTTDPANDFDPSWSPDGQKILFSSDRNGTNDIWQVVVDGVTGTPLEPPILLASGVASDAQPRLSPDGTLLAFYSTRSDPAGDLHLTDADGVSNEVLVSTSTAWDGSFSWAPDGSEGVYATQSTTPASLLRVTINGGTSPPTVGTPTAFPSITPLSNAAVDPDWSPFMAPVPFVDSGVLPTNTLKGTVRWGDYNNGGDPDLLVTGGTSTFSFPIAEIWQNDTIGAPSFFQAVSFPIATENGSWEWGDYDGDGDLDLLGNGLDTNGTIVFVLYRNDFDNFFTEVPTGIAGTTGGTSLWVDFDNDGDLDIFMTGSDGTAPVARLYRNDGNDTFVDVNIDSNADGIGDAGIRYLSSSSAAWGDYDNDGDLDLAMTGLDASFLRYTVVVRNNGDGTFTEVATLTGLDSKGAVGHGVAWGDLDGDGDLDLVVTGESAVGNKADVYLNVDPSVPAFDPIATPFVGVRQAAVALGDYDSDGDLDVLIAGHSGTEPVTRLYANDGTATFARVPLSGLPHLFEAALDFADYDGDGDLDLVYNGYDGGSFFTSIFTNVLDVANTAPTSPGVSTSPPLVDAYGNVTFEWTPGTDAETPPAGLTYNLRVGTTPGGNEILPSMSLSTGERLVPRPGNVGHNTTWTLQGLPNGTYYWAVQTVDSGQLASSFTTEQTFVVDRANTNLVATFDGINGDIVTSASTLFGDYSAITMEFWFYPETFGGNSASGTSTLLLSNHTPDVADLDIGFEFFDDGRLEFALWSADGGKKAAMTTISTALRWYHVVGVFDGGELRLFLDGELADSVAATRSTLAGARPILIGASRCPSGSGLSCEGGVLNGYIDEVRIWSVALPRRKFRLLQGQHPTGAEANLIGYWNFDGAGATDLTANANDGTLNGNVGFVNAGFLASSGIPLRLGVADTGVSLSGTFTVTNKGNLPVSVAGLTSSNPLFAVTPTVFTLNQGQSQTVTVTLTPSAPGPEFTKLTVDHDSVGAIVLAASGVGRTAPPTGDLNHTRIAFSTDRDAVPEVYVMAPDGASPTRLTTSSSTDRPTGWFPDGTRIVFQTDRDADNEVYVMNADGSNPVDLTVDPSSDGGGILSPDGTKIAFTSTRDGDSEVYVMNTDGSNPLNLTNDPAVDSDPTWSPDGTKIAFTSTRDGDSEIYVMNADGTGIVNLTRNPATDKLASWSPDGTKIAFWSNRSGTDALYVMDADGSNVVGLGLTGSSTDARIAWSPDGTKMATSSNTTGDFEIYVMNADGTGITNVTNTPASSEVHAAWSPFLPTNLGWLVVDENGATRSVAFGFDPAATDGVALFSGGDSQSADVPLPAEIPGSTPSLRLIRNDGVSDVDLLRDLVASPTGGVVKTWTIKARVSGGTASTATLSWDQGEIDALLASGGYSRAVLENRTTGEITQLIAANNPIALNTMDAGVYEFELRFETTAASYPLTVNLSSGWNLVSVPGLGDLTPLNVAKAAAYGWDPVLGQYQSETVLDETTLPPTVRGMFLYVTPSNAGPVALTLDVDDSIVRMASVTIENGWNLIGAPAALPGPVPASLVDGGNPNNVLAFDSTTESYAVATTLAEGQGYWVLNPGTSFIVALGQLRDLDPNGAGILFQTPPKPPKPDWTLPLTFDLDNGAERTVTLGASAQAKRTYDRFDLAQPPTIREKPFATFYAKVNDVARRLTRSIQPVDKRGAEWELVAELPKPATLRWEGIDLPQGYRIVLATTQKTFDLGRSGSARFDAGSHRLRVRVTWQPPQATTALPNYPNPFNPETWIPFELNNGAEVTVRIYDMEGRLVRQLDLGFREAGYYSTRAEAAYWDGRNALGEPVASGVYFYELRAGSFRTVRRMILLK